jgi:hypothetical protein
MEHAGPALVNYLQNVNIAAETIALKLTSCREALRPLRNALRTKVGMACTASHSQSSRRWCTVTVVIARAPAGSRTLLELRFQLCHLPGQCLQRFQGPLRKDCRDPVVNVTRPFLEAPDRRLVATQPAGSGLNPYAR